MPRVGVLIVVAAALCAGMFTLQRSRAYPFYLMRASEQIEDGKSEAAIPLYEAALKLRPDSAAAIHFEMGRVYWEKKDYASAEHELQQALAMHPTDQAILYVLGGVRLEEHHFADARQSFAQLLAMNPQSAEAHLGVGVVAFSEGNCALAQSEYAEAEHLNPQLAELHARQGACLMRQKDFDGAIAAFRKEIEISGDDEASERSLAEAYTAKGMTTEADAATQQADALKAKAVQE
jgi:tetratricopeptide (TPR) repeat protein